MAAGASLAFSGLAGLVSGYGQMQGQKYEAQKAKRAGQIARVQADQIDSQYREELSSTISNIRAIRASTDANPNSPTSLAVIGEEERVSSRERRIKTGGIRMQADQYDSDAAYLRRSAKWSLIGGAVSGLASGLR